MSVTKPPAWDGKTSGEAWYKHVLKPDGTSYAAFSKFLPWKQWVDKLYEPIRTLEVRADNQKEHLDENSAEIQNLQARVAALEARPPSVPFPGSG